MARQDKISGRYARAIVDFVKDGGKIGKMVEELRRFSTILSSNDELHRVLLTDLFPQKDRRAVIEDLAKRIGLAPDTIRILLVLSEAHRLSALGGIAEKLNLLLLESAGTMPIEVNAASALSHDEKEKVERRFATLLGKKVEAKYHVNTALIGGLRVTAAGRTYDGTLSGWLDNFEEQLVGGRL